MAHTQNFYSPLPYNVATDRLKHAKVRGVHINLNEADSHSSEFILNLLQEFPIVPNLTLAHCKGKITRTQGQNLRVEYKTYGLSSKSTWLVPLIGLSITLILMGVLPANLLPIASVPGVAGLIFTVFWSTFSDEVRKGDQLRLQELLERMLEKQTSMATWQA